MKEIILHACCAPCASYPIQLLSKDNFRPVVFFYNPNIFPYEEYKIRHGELKKYCEKLSIDFFEGDYDKELYYKNINGHEKEPEKGKRCSLCFYLRLKTSALFAKEQNISINLNLDTSLDMV